ncbi:MAG: radical SAM protein [Anaerolineales bacterium]|jgi:pyruvate formate-lyase activating enzyme-like uncharacterized protein|nr:radical SAM protein [Anaerolineales bacterium]
MIIEINESTLASIRNPELRSQAGQYVQIYQDFMDQVRQMGLDVEALDDSQQVAQRLSDLGKRGAIVRNDAKSVYTQRISGGCLACQRGIGSRTFFISLKCHRDCFFCFNPNQEDYQHHREHKRDVAAELDALQQSGGPAQHLALTGGEPLLYKEETINFFQHARQNFPKAYTRLYTCGDQLERETLQAFKEAGMDEIRFSIRVEDTPTARQHTFDQIALAREYIPNVMVEMPVLPDSREAMQEILLELERLGVFGINLLEFCFPLHNAQEYRARGYLIKARPFRVLYNYWYAGGLPVAGSEQACLDLIEFALEQGLQLGVHYCSLENKHTGQIYQQDLKPVKMNVLYFSRRDYFLKAAKVFGKDAEIAKAAFQKNGYRDYRAGDKPGSLVFHVSKIRMLKKLDIEVGISTNVLEERGGETYLRELKLDLTYPKDFRLSDI